jgi:zinc protease
MFTTFVCLLFIITLAAQETDSFANQLLPEDPNLKTGVLENGLRYVIRKNSQPPNRAELRLIVDVGAIDEDDDQLGLAHFTEHMAFKGTKNFSKQEMINYLNSVGMGFGGGLNAFTSQQNTAYSLSAPTDDDEQMEKAFQILSEMGHYAIFDEAELEEERGVIIEEWRMYQGASQRIQDRVQKVMLSGSRYAERTPIGSIDVLQNFEQETIKRFYKDWYRPDMQTLLVIGDFDIEKIESIVKKYFGALPASENPRERELYPVPDHTEPLAIVAIDDEMSYTSVNMTWKHAPVSFKTMEDYLQNTIVNLGTDMLNARLEELTRTADSPVSYAASYLYNVTYTKSGFFLTAYTAEDKALSATEALLLEAERIKQFGFTPGELQRAKSRMITNLEQKVSDKDKELSGRLTWAYLRRIMNKQTLMGEEQNLELFNLLSQYIDIETINQKMASFITDDNFVISVTGPEKEGLVYPTEEELLAVRETVKQLPISQYVDTVSDEPLMTNIPKPGKIKKEKMIKEAGIKQWTLSNGAVVYAKKTEYKNDEVLFYAKSPGGYSLYPGEDAITAQNAANIVLESGFGEFDKNTLDKTLSGSIVNLDIFIERESEGFSGNFAPKSTETFFQMLYQYATNPRQNEQSFASYIQKQISFTENRSLNPEAVFWDSVGVIINNNNPYQKAAKSKDLKQIQLDNAMRIYQDRFADFSDFTFFFVGNFDEEQLKEYCSIYLANLPKQSRKETYRTVTEPISKGSLNKTVSIGKDEKSIIYTRSGGKVNYSPEMLTEFNALQLLLNEKLRVNIREKLSGVYYVGLQMKAETTPIEHYAWETILFCAPDRHHELYEATYATIDSVRAGFVTDEDVNFVKTTLLRNLETQEIRNQYYLSQMTNSFWNDIPFDDYLNKKRRIEQMDKKSIVNTAKTYLTYEDNLTRIVKVPKE